MNIPQYPPNLQQWLIVHRLLGGTAQLVNALRVFGDLDAVLQRPPRDFAAAGLAPQSWEWWQRIKSGFADPLLVAQAKQDEAWLQDNDAYVIPFGSIGYPDLLAEIHSPPMLLYVRGDPVALHLPQIAMVGSRRPSTAAKENAYRFAHHLASGGFTITSGLALGIDGASHEGAIAANGTTVGVMATGLDRIYPYRHQALAEQICDHGALVTEFPLGFKPLKPHFPQRNRIISGLSLGVLVVEATIQSGSLITARQALEQNREVFAIPGSIHNPLSKGCHQLIRQGATLVESADDILAELGGALQALSGKASIDQARNMLADASLSACEKLVLKELGYDPASFDVLLARTQLSTAELSAALIQLEIHNLVEQAAGYYSVK